MLHPRTRTALLALLAASTLAAACNAITGTDELVVGDPAQPKGSDDDDDDDDGRDDDDDDGRDDDDGDGGSTGEGATTGDGSSTSSGPQQQLVDVAGVGLTDVSFYQGVKARLVAAGTAATPSVPVVAGRDALVRVFPDVSGYDGGPVVVRLLIEGQTPLEVDTTLGGGSESNLGSTVNFDVPGTMLAAGARFRVEIKRRQTEAGPAAPASSYPSDGSYAATNAQTTGSLRVTIVPIAYGGDGSNRTPDTGAAQVAAYEDHFTRLYPASQVELRVRGGTSYDQAVGAGDIEAWGGLLNAFAQFRAGDGAAFDEYYYGILNPASSGSAYCGGGCIAGLGFVGEAGDDYSRASVGLGFGGDFSTGIAVHEVGHNHGRGHAPCRVDDADPGFPHPGGKIGEWGYDLLERSMKNPDTHVDLMGYCDPAWVSDYTYRAFFDRMQAIDGAAYQYIPEEARNLTYERVAAFASGATWLDPVTIERPPFGERRTLVVGTDDGAEREVEAAFYRYDHADGGLYLFPRGDRAASLVELEIGGVATTVAR